MKAKLLIDIPEENLSKGSLVEIINRNFYYYVCKLPNNKHINIVADNLEITDYTPYIDWEQRRYEIAKAALQGILSNEQAQLFARLNYKLDTTTSRNIAYAVAHTDALIEELKKK